MVSGGNRYPEPDVGACTLLAECLESTLISNAVGLEALLRQSRPNILTSRHWDTLIAADFFTSDVVLERINYLLRCFVIELHSRLVHV